MRLQLLHARDFQPVRARLRVLTLKGSHGLPPADGERLSRTAFERRQNELFPDLVFGYYSGGSRRLEKLFDSHQRRYYDAIKTNDNAEACRQALIKRRLFYCRPIHGVFALLSFFAFSVTSSIKSAIGSVTRTSSRSHREMVSGVTRRRRAKPLCDNRSRFRARRTWAPIITVPIAR